MCNNTLHICRWYESLSPSFTLSVCVSTCMCAHSYQSCFLFWWAAKNFEHACNLKHTFLSDISNAGEFVIPWNYFKDELHWIRMAHMVGRCHRSKITVACGWWACFVPSFLPQNPQWINASANNHIIFHQPNNHLYSFYPVCFMSTSGNLFYCTFAIVISLSEKSVETFFRAHFSNKPESGVHSCSSKRTPTVLWFEIQHAMRRTNIF